MVDREIERLVSAYAGVITRAVRRVAGARAQGLEDDVHQAVMVGLWQQLQRGQTIAQPASYIFRAAIRETLRLVRREQARAGEAPPIEQIAAPASMGDPDRHLEASERRQILGEAIAALAPNRQQAVRAHLAGFGVRDIMEMFGWTYQTARHAIARGMADLRAALRQRGIED